MAHITHTQGSAVLVCAPAHTPHWLVGLKMVGDPIGQPGCQSWREGERMQNEDRLPRTGQDDGRREGEKNHIHTHTSLCCQAVRGKKVEEKENNFQCGMKLDLKWGQTHWWAIHSLSERRLWWCCVLFIVRKNPMHLIHPSMKTTHIPTPSTSQVS